MKEVEYWGSNERKESRKCVYLSMCVHLREKTRDCERESEREGHRDHICQGCYVSNVMVEPLQCTKTKGREGV